MFAFLKPQHSTATEAFPTLDADALLAHAQQHAQEYQQAEPFPHIILDDFLPPALAENIVSAFPPPEHPSWFERDTVNQPGKLGVGNAENVQKCPATIQHALLLLNSHPIIQFLEALTGIPALIPDPHLQGGGIHQILPGGKLAVHADFNFHEHLQLYRRINMLIYLNKDWEESYGGHLELWDKEMQHCTHRVLPIFNRCVIFNTSRTSYHGHPEPLTCPEGNSRKSIALYYYTVENPTQSDEHHSTLWQERP